MKPGLRFLIAAKRCEITELDQLARTGALVESVARLIHELQRERGLSNLYLASCGRRWADERSSQIGRSDAAQARVLACFDDLDTEDGALRLGARLHARIAYALQGLDALVTLRQRIDAQATSPAQASADLARLISALLAVVFEAADSATEPLISRRLVALFNFMQGKEFAGQERAAGAAAFAAGASGRPGEGALLHLIDAQEACFERFEAFCPPDVLAAWRAAQAAMPLAELERLRRRLIAAGQGTALAPALAEGWFACCSQRLDQIREIESALAVGLRAACAQRIAALQRDPDDPQAVLEEHMGRADTATPLGMLVAEAADGKPPAEADRAAAVPGEPLGPRLTRSIVDVLHAQSCRLQAMSDELAAVRATLDERKLIERAKGVLMRHQGLSEDEAYRLLRQTAMNQGRRLADVAQAALAIAAFLPDRK